MISFFRVEKDDSMQALSLHALTAHTLADFKLTIACLKSDIVNSLVILLKTSQLFYDGISLQYQLNIANLHPLLYR